MYFTFDFEVRTFFFLTSCGIWYVFSELEQSPNEFKIGFNCIFFKEHYYDPSRSQKNH